MALATPLGKPLAQQTRRPAGTYNWSTPGSSFQRPQQVNTSSINAQLQGTLPNTYVKSGTTNVSLAPWAPGVPGREQYIDPLTGQIKPGYVTNGGINWAAVNATKAANSPVNATRPPTASELQNVYNRNWQDIGAPRMSEAEARNKFTLDNLQQQLDAMLKGKEQQLGNNQAEIDLKKQLQDLNASDIGIDKGAASRGIMLASQLIGLNNSQLQSEQAQFTNLEKNLEEITRISRDKASLQLASQTRQTKSDAIARGGILSRGYEDTISEFNKANQLENQELTEKYRSGMEGYKIGREQSQIKADERHKELSETVSKGYDTINKLTNDLARVGINKKLLDLELKNAASQLGVDKILAQLQYAEKKGQLDGNLKDLYYGLVDQIAQKTQTIAQNPWAMDVLRNSVWTQSPTSQAQQVIKPSRPGQVKAI